MSSNVYLYNNASRKNTIRVSVKRMSASLHPRSHCLQGVLSSSFLYPELIKWYWRTWWRYLCWSYARRTQQIGFSSTTLLHFGGDINLRSAFLSHQCCTCRVSDIYRIVCLFFSNFCPLEVVLYVHHDETGRRLVSPPGSAFHQSSRDTAMIDDTAMTSSDMVMTRW